jgi:hypothetical protein
MAEGLPGRLENALRAVDKILAGDPAPVAWGEDLEFVERFLGLDKPLAEYAPRTRRRYISAARKGQTAAQARQSERAQRTTSTLNRYGMTPNEWGKVGKLIRTIQSSGIDINEYFDPDVIKNVVEMYGVEYLIDVLTQQIDSIREYTRGNVMPGRTRWNDRGSLEEEAAARMQQSFAAAIYFIKGTDPYYYYHGRLI